MPEGAVKEIMLFKRLPDEAGYAAGVAWDARRKPTEPEVIAMLGGLIGREIVDFQLYQLRGQAEAPELEWKITAAGVDYTIKAINRKQFDGVHTCTCLRHAS